jgi:hypothetical protein
MERELQEAKDAWATNTNNAQALLEVLQVVAVGVACLEQHGYVGRDDFVILNTPSLKAQRRKEMWICAECHSPIEDPHGVGCSIGRRINAVMEDREPSRPSLDTTGEVYG